MFAAAAVLLLAVYGCSASRRIERIARNHDLLYSSTITIKDTLFVPQIDTCYIVPLEGHVFGMVDTLNKIGVSGIVERDSVVLCVRRYTDTVIIEKKVPVDKIVLQDGVRNRNWALAGMVAWLSCFFMACLFYLSRK